MTRTDQHAPTNFDPESYTFLGTLDLTPDPFDEFAREENQRTMAAVRRHGLADGNFATKGTCDHCGSSFRWASAFLHAPTGDAVVFGHVCAENRVGSMSKADFQMRRRKKAARAAKAARETREARAAWEAEHADLNELLHDEENDMHNSGFFWSLREYLRKHACLTEKQIAALQRIRDQQAERERAVAEEADKPERESAFVGTVGDRIDTEVTVAWSKLVESDFGASKLITMTDDDGRVIKSFYSGSNDRLWDLVPGDRLHVRATVSRHDLWKGEKQTLVKRLHLCGVLHLADDDTPTID